MKPLHMLDPGRFETPAILKQLTRSSRQLGELKGVIASMPRQVILMLSVGHYRPKLFIAHQARWPDKTLKECPVSPSDNDFALMDRMKPI